jgi:hypothetical protein
MEDKAKDAVREYLQKKGVTEYTEELWGKVDSVFTPFNLDMSYNLTNSRIKMDISRHELTISELKFNPGKNKSRIKTLKDSVSLLKDSLNTVKTMYYDRLNKREKNRLGIFLKLKYKTLLGAEKTRRFTFVFNQNESELSVGHHLDEIGNVCE